MTTTTRKHTPRADVKHIGKIIEANILPDGEKDGQKYIKYKDGWDDERVATVSSVPLHTVRKIRQELFGQMRIGGGNLFKLLSERMDALERRIAELEDAATKPRVVKSFADLPLNGSRS